MTCEFAISVVLWLSFYSTVGVFGLIFVALGSLGNYAKSPVWKPALALAVTLLVTFMPFVFINDPNSFLDTSRKGSYSSYVFPVAGVFGFMTALFQISHIVALVIPMHVLDHNNALRRMLKSSDMMSEKRTKQAAAYKTALMTKNALEIVRVKDSERKTLNTHFSRSLSEFSQNGRKFQTIGGFVYCWRLIISKEAFFKDGIWFSTRTVTGNLAQWIAALLFYVAGLGLLLKVATDYSTEAGKRYFYKLLDYAVSFVVESDRADNFLTTASSLFASFLHQYVGLLNCPTHSQIPENCYKVSDLNGSHKYTCNHTPGVDFFCPLAASTLDPSLQRALLSAAGFNESMLLNFIEDALKGTTATVESLYPSKKSMVVVPLFLGLCKSHFAASLLKGVFSVSHRVECLIVILRSCRFHYCRLCCNGVYSIGHKYNFAVTLWSDTNFAQ
jgi:hypothetical protein